jgi:hypothetical protein
LRNFVGAFVAVLVQLVHQHHLAVGRQHFFRQQQIKQRIHSK